ncbi:hypothetical protein B0H14DRAFT_2574984 [Mycena olivaceomarginata]|nr:hypothetical protein B0H14DRAFT_2574984 [Mycena olivaceomarginata]
MKIEEDEHSLLGTIQAQSPYTERIFNRTKSQTRMVVGAPRRQSMRYNPDNTSPLNFWYLPAPCNVILYMFLLEADKVENITESTRPEILLAQKIYTDLKEVRDRVARRARFRSKPARHPAGVADSVAPAKPQSQSTDGMSASQHTPRRETDKCRPTAKSHPFAVQSPKLRERVDAKFIPTRDIEGITPPHVKRSSPPQTDPSGFWC